ncbi:MAG: hypothetical protein KAS76_01160 [Thermoplasmatales archaeon]|nr:hypothetical protein [Thermoplasmatales archaeon]
MKQNIFGKILALMIVLLFIGSIRPSNGTIINRESRIFKQVDFLQGDNSVLNSAWGHVDVTYIGSTEFQYYNLVVNGDWQIRNAPLWSFKGTGVEHHIGLIFDLKVQDGTDVTYLEYIDEISPFTLSSPPTGVPSSVIVSDKLVTVGGRGEDGVPGGGAVEIDFDVGMVIIEGAFNLCFNNQDCGVDECVPASFSNSLRYLDDFYDLDIPENLISIDGLKDPTNWASPDIDIHGDPIPGTGGCPDDNSDWQGKREALEDYVTTEKYTMDQIDLVMDQLNLYQDVELFGPHHAATVNVILKIQEEEDIYYLIGISHDTEQGRMGGTEYQAVKYDPDTEKVVSSVFGFAAGESLDWFVVECPNNDPPSMPVINGPENGVIDTFYDYSFTSVDPDGNDISYYVKWGDGTFEDWFGPFSSGESQIRSHKWMFPWRYSIEARARDTFGAMSDWAKLTVTIPRAKAINTPFLNFLENHPILYQLLQRLLQL